MKVICIDVSNLSKRSILKQGEIYTVTGEADWAPVPCYELQEHPDEGYEKFRFIPISNIDEKEFIREYKKELV